MLNKISKNLAQSLLKRADKPQYSQDVYTYGFELIISTAVGLLAILLLSMLFSNLLVGIVFIISFVPLRLFTGGYHASTYGRCFTVSILTYMMLLIIHEAINRIVGSEVIISLFVCAAWYIIKNAPKMHHNQVLSEMKIVRSKLMVKKIIFIECFWIAFLSAIRYELMCMAVLSICLVAAFMLFADNPIKKGVMEV